MSERPVLSSHSTESRMIRTLKRSVLSGVVMGSLLGAGSVDRGLRIGFEWSAGSFLTIESVRDLTEIDKSVRGGNRLKFITKSLKALGKWTAGYAIYGASLAGGVSNPESAVIGGWIGAMVGAVPFTGILIYTSNLASKEKGETAIVTQPN